MDFGFSSDFLKAFAEFKDQLLPLSGTTKEYSPQAWFVGPRGENAEILKELVTIAIDSTIEARKNFNKTDEDIIDEHFKSKQEYKNALEDMKKKTLAICKFLKKSLPFSSFRYQGHMNSDVLIPAVTGWISAMIYNPNNCSHQGSPTTTYTEICVINDLARMVGFRFGEKIDRNLPKKQQLELEIKRVTPYGTIASGGTIANIQALWSAYWVKFIPLALREAIKHETVLENAKQLKVKLANGPLKKLLSIDSWEGANIECDECVSLPYKAALECEIESSQVMFLLKKYHPSNIGSFEFFTQHGLKAPVFLAPVTCHYSIPKAIALLGLGTNSLKLIAVDDRTRMDLVHLKANIEACISHKIPIINVTAVMGTTEESSVDNLCEIVDYRNKLRTQQGFDFTIHSDSAYGGYFASCIRADYPIDDPESDILNPSNCHLDIPDGASPYGALNNSDPELYLSDYFAIQLKNLHRADTVVIDPHKLGYIQYPAGAILYRNGKFKDILTYSTAYIIGGSQKYESTGIYCIEGSRPGAAAASCYLAHSIIRTSKSGYGMILKRAMLNAKLFYLHLVWLASPNDPFIVRPVNEPDEETLKKIKEKIIKNGKFISVDEIAADLDLIKLLSNIGSDQNVLSYTFNYKNKDGSINSDYSKFKLFNKKVYERFDYIPEDNMKEFDFVVSSTSFGPSYGSAATNLLKRCNISNYPTDYEVPLIRSAIMDVFASESLNNFSAFAKVMDILKKELIRFSDQMNNLN